MMRLLMAAYRRINEYGPARPRRRAHSQPRYLPRSGPIPSLPLYPRPHLVYVSRSTHPPWASQAAPQPDRQRVRRHQCDEGQLTNDERLGYNR